MLAIFTNFSSGQIVAIILLTAFILTVWLVKFFCLSRINIIDLSITIVLFLLCLFVDLNEILIIIVYHFYSLFQCFCSCLFISRTSVAKFKGLAKWLFIPAFFASMISSAKASAVIATIGTVLASDLAEARIFCVAS